MQNNRSKMIAAVILGIIFIIIGYIYASRGAGSLPTFFPGYQAGAAHVHTKHSIAAFVVGAALFIYAWFQGGPKNTLPSQEA